MPRPGVEPVSLRVRIVAAGLSIFAASVGAGCAADDSNPYFGAIQRPPRDVGTFYSNTTGEPEYLDPGKAADAASTSLIGQLFEGLTSLDPRDTHPVQGVAESFEQSADNRLYRFHLREGAKWSDGAPVKASDFEYAWKRVLRPATASRGATLLHVLANGALFNHGKLRVTTEDRALLVEPRSDAPLGERLPKGTAVELLARSPSVVVTAVAPLAEMPASVRFVSWSRADAKKGAPERLSFGGERPAIAAAPGGGWKDAEVLVLDAGPPVDCDSVADRWFLVQRGAERGFLPGCMLGRSKAPGSFALVERHDKLPTYRAAAPEAREKPSTKGRGFIAEAALVEDDRVVGVRATDDRTLEVELEYPTPYFVDLTSQSTLFPVRRDVVEAFERRGEPDLWTRPQSIVGNGAYILTSSKFRYEMTMDENPYYWNRDKLKIHRIVWLEVEDYHPTMNLYKASEIDYIGDGLAPPPEYQPLLKLKKDYRRNSFLSVYWYELNTKKPPLDDVRVRRALNLAIDKQQLVEKVTRGGQTPATHYVPDFTGLGYSEQVAADRAAGADPFKAPGMDYDPEQARALMKEAGYEVVPDGDGRRADRCPPLQILYNTNEGHRAIAVAIQDMWKRNLGVTATLRNEEFKVMLKSHRDGDFTVIRASCQAEVNHPQTFLNTFLSTHPENQSGWGDPAFDAALATAAATPDRKDSIRAYRRAEAIALEGMARIPFYFYTKSTLVKPWVKGFYGLPLGYHPIQYLWIDPDGAQHPGNEPAYPPPELPPPGVYTP